MQPDIQKLRKTGGDESIGVGSSVEEKERERKRGWTKGTEKGKDCQLSSLVIIKRLRGTKIA